MSAGASSHIGTSISYTLKVKEEEQEAAMRQMVGVT